MKFWFFLIILLSLTLFYFITVDQLFRYERHWLKGARDSSYMLGVNIDIKDVPFRRWIANCVAFGLFKLWEPDKKYNPLQFFLALCILHPGFIGYLCTVYKDCVWRKDKGSIPVSLASECWDHQTLLSLHTGKGFIFFFWKKERNTCVAVYCPNGPLQMSQQPFRAIRFLDICFFVVTLWALLRSFERKKRFRQRYFRILWNLCLFNEM